MGVSTRAKKVIGWSIAAVLLAVVALYLWARFFLFGPPTPWDDMDLKADSLVFSEDFELVGRERDGDRGYRS